MVYNITAHQLIKNIDYRNPHICASNVRSRLFNVMLGNSETI